MLKVLIAEDEPPIAWAIQRLIEQTSGDFQVIGRAMNGREALEMMRLQGADVVFTDIRMPVMDGLRLLEELRRDWPDCLSVVLSGHQDFSYAQAALRQGAFDYLLKPLSKDALKSLLSRLQEAIAERDMHKPLPRPAIDERAGKPDNLAAHMERYISDNYSRDISSETLSAQFGYVPSYLGKIFRDQTGLTPSQYVTRLRMEKAKALFAEHPGMRVGEVARLVGYKDVYYFSKLFKKATGLWPSQYTGQE